MLFKYDKNKNELIQLEKTAFSTEKLTEPQNIETWIRKNPSILSESEGEDITIIGEQKTSLTMKKLDLLGVDNFGNIVTVELKRDLAGKMTEHQAITYASFSVHTTFDEACKIYAEYLEKNKTELDLLETSNFLEKAEDNLRSRCDASINLPEDFNKNQRVILVAGEFSEDLLSAVTWLILKGIKIECIKLELYNHNGELFVYPAKILPTPDISENIVKFKIAEEEIDRKRATYQTWKGDIEDHYRRLKHPLADYLKNLVEELNIEPTTLSGSGLHLINGKKKIMVSTWQKNKIEFRFAKAKKEDIEKLLVDSNTTSLKVKDKADIESYGLESPTPSIDYKEDYGSFEDIKKICRRWLEI